MVKTASILAALLLLCSCASTQPSGTAELTGGGAQPQATIGEAPNDTALAEAGEQAKPLAADDEEKEYCTKVKKTGSRIPQFYCRKRSDDERARQHSKGWLDKVKRTPQQSVEISG